MEHAIIISSGRCGSTLLSDLIAAEPGTLSAQEFTGSMPGPREGWTEPLNGADYWRAASGPLPELRTLTRLGIEVQERRYPRTGRWGRDIANLPRILGATLSKLSPDPDALFDQLGQAVSNFPMQPMPVHHHRLLDTLAAMLGRRQWVERSGGSSMHTRELLQAFPSARVIYLTRDWQATAASMSKHPMYRLRILRNQVQMRYGFDPCVPPPESAVPADGRRFLPEHLRPEDLPTPEEAVAGSAMMCAFMHGQAEQAFRELRPERLLRMTYEDLVAEPGRVLTTVGEFLDLPEPDRWAAGCAEHVRRPRAGAPT